MLDQTGNSDETIQERDGVGSEVWVNRLSKSVHDAC